MKKLIICALLLSLSLTSFAGKVFHEKLNYRIILPDNPTKICSFAAEELKKILDETYDAPVKFNGKTDPVDFYVGVSGAAVMAGFTDIPPMENKFGIFRKDRSILLFGSEDAGLDPEENAFGFAGPLHATYYFLNKYLGAAFYFPGDKGYSITKNKSVDFEEDSDVANPSFEVRGFTTYTKEFSAKDSNAFFWRMLCCIPRWAHHDVSYYMYNWKKRFWETHPEYFMLRDGKRISEKYPYHTPCLSNPDVIKQTAADLVDKIDANTNRSIKTIRLFCDAPTAQCQCERCAKSKERALAGGVDEKSHDEFYGFQKKVADIVHQSHPDIFFMTQTKGSSYYLPPKLVKLGPFFMVQILNDRAFNKTNWQESLEIARAWKEAGVRTMLKSYPRYPEWLDYPVINPQKTIAYYKKFHGVCLGDGFSDLAINAPYSFCALGQFVQAKALFNLNASFDKMLEDFCSFAYPGAEKEMMEFYREMEKLFLQGKSRFNPLINVYTAENLKKPMTLMDAASKKVRQDSVWFEKLHADFKKFHDHAMDESRKVENLQKNQCKILKPQFLDEPMDIAVQNDPGKWKDVSTNELVTCFLYENFQKGVAFSACDKNYLYIGLVAFEEKTGDLRKSCTENGKGELWSDDSFEISLVPHDKFEGKNYYQVVVNSLGVYRVLQRVEGSSKIEDADDFKLETAAKIDKDKWIAVMKIPLAQFPKSSFKHSWRISVFRVRCLNAPNSGDRQISGLMLKSDSFHELNHFTELMWPPQLSR